jgi:hypothetical protein
MNVYDLDLLLTQYIFSDVIFLYTPIDSTLPEFAVPPCRFSFSLNLQMATTDPRTSAIKGYRQKLLQHREIEAKVKERIQNLT